MRDGRVCLNQNALGRAVGNELRWRVADVNKELVDVGWDLCGCEDPLDVLILEV